MQNVIFGIKFEYVFLLFGRCYYQMISLKGNQPSFRRLGQFKRICKMHLFIIPQNKKQTLPTAQLLLLAAVELIIIIIIIRLNRHVVFTSCMHEVHSQALSQSLSFFIGTLQAFLEWLYSKYNMVDVTSQITELEYGSRPYKQRTG